MKNNKKLDVHLVEHTHWDREWYFTSDDSRTMLYYDMKFMIDHLLKNEDNFTYDGQSSIIDDFLKYSPEWKEKLVKVVKARRLFVGPFYTAVDDTVAAGESISRNLEMGTHIAEEVGHSMKVGYLPDTFGHNNQIPQILRMNGLSNLSFYRGIDPEKIDDKIYFKYVSPDGSSVLAHWQTHYTTRGFGPTVDESQYSEKWFKEKIIDDYSKQGEFGPSAESYSKRNFNLPIAIPIGTDQRPFSGLMPKLTAKMNKKDKKFNFINSNYEDFLDSVEKQVKAGKVDLAEIKTELRVAKTGRVHRTVASSRMDIKQRHFELEHLLINVLEPMSIMCHMNNIDVPWDMINAVWKDLHKSSAHDSYACSNEDHVNRKLKQRLTNAIRIGWGVVSMLSRIYSQKIISEKKDEYKKMVMFNYKHNTYNGSYQIIANVKRGFENGKFKLFDGKNELKYSILDRNNMGTHERDALTILIHDVTINPFSHKVIDIKYDDKDFNYNLDKSNSISAGNMSVSVHKNNLVFTVGEKKYKNLIKIAIDASVGDTYDHSPITFNDKKYIVSNYKVIEREEKMNTIKFTGSVKVPCGIDGWTKNKTSVNQDVTMQVTILDGKFHVHVIAVNKSSNARMNFMIDSLSDSDKWYHDQQFGIYEREIENEYMDKWSQTDSLNYKWKEYPTNLSPFQSFVSNISSDLTVYAEGTKEHELINHNGIKYFSLTLYRAFGKFGTEKVAYRPGRASGARCDSIDSQLIGDKLSYDFIIDPNKTTVQKQFKSAEETHLKNYYIPKEWGLERTILRWSTNLNYYDNDKKNRSFKLKLPEFAKKEGIITSSIYKRMNGDVVVRLLNVGEDVKIKKSTHKISRTLHNFKPQNLELPKYGLVNILIGKG